MQKEGSHEEGNCKECFCNDRARALVDPRSRILRVALADWSDLFVPRQCIDPLALVMYGQMYGQGE